MSTVIVTTDDALEAIVERQVKRAFELAGVRMPSSGDMVKVDNEVSTTIARKMLTAKGYSVKSFDGLRSVLDRHKVNGTMRGRDMWYNGSEVDAIPAKK